MAPPCKSRTTAEPFSNRRNGYTITRLAAEGRSDRGSLRIVVVNTLSPAHACAARVSPHSGSRTRFTQHRSDGLPKLTFHDPWAGWVPIGRRDFPNRRSLYYKANSALPSPQLFGGRDTPQMFSGFSSLIPQCRGWSGSTYTTSAVARLSVRRT